MNKPHAAAVSALFLIILLAFTGCSHMRGDVIQVTTPESSADTAAGLSKTARAALESVKQSSGHDNSETDLQTILADKAHYLTVTEYLQKYPENASEASADYRVGGNDVISLSVYNAEDLESKARRVSVDGYVSMPLIGRFKVAGLTTTEIEELIAQKLLKGYMVDPQVTVRVIDYNSKWFRVLGAVEEPKSLPLSINANQRILDAISRAGGVKSGGCGRKAKLVRLENPGTTQEQQLVIEIDLQRLMHSPDQQGNILLQDKDTLYITSPERYYIIGEVKKPGAYSLPDRDISLIESIGIAGGFTNFASRNNATIIRNQNGQESLIKVRVDDLTKMGMQMRELILQPNDIVIVPQSFF